MQADGYGTLRAHDGRQALAVAMERKPDLIPLDVMMPVMDGFETAALLKANPLTQHIPSSWSRRWMTVLLQTAPISIYAARVSGDFGTTYISPSVHQQLGYAPQDFTADPGFWLSHVHPDDQARVLAQQAKAMGDQSAAPLEYRFRHQDGTWRWSSRCTAATPFCRRWPLGRRAS